MNARPRRPRNPGFEVPVPPECREMIRRGALVSISTSGGKDSQAMTILLTRVVPRDQIVAVHAPLGEVEWPGTIDHHLEPVQHVADLLDREHAFLDQPVDHGGNHIAHSLRGGAGHLDPGFREFPISLVHFPLSRSCVRRPVRRRSPALAGADRHPAGPARFRRPGRTEPRPTGPLVGAAATRRPGAGHPRGAPSPHPATR